MKKQPIIILLLALTAALALLLIARKPTRQAHETTTQPETEITAPVAAPTLVPAPTPPETPLPAPTATAEPVPDEEYSVLDELPPPSLDQIIPADTLDTWDETFAAIANLPNDLGTLDRLVIWRYLADPIPPAMNAGERAMEAGIRNDLLNVVLRQQPYPIEATERMLGLSRQDIGDEVIQAYITQHISVAYERDPSAARRDEIRQRLWEIADHMSTDDGGTALIALVRLNPAEADEERTRLAAHARKWLDDPSIPPRNLVPLLHTLGQCGTPDDIPALERHEAAAPNTVVRLAARFALLQLNPEQEQPAE